MNDINKDRPESKWTFYSPKFKIEVIDYAKTNSNTRAAGHFKVAYDCVRRWVRDEDRIRGMRSVPPSRCNAKSKKVAFS